MSKYIAFVGEYDTHDSCACKGISGFLATLDCNYIQMINPTDDLPYDDIAAVVVDLGKNKDHSKLVRYVINLRHDREVKVILVDKYNTSSDATTRAIQPELILNGKTTPEEIRTEVCDIIAEWNKILTSEKSKNQMRQILAELQETSDIYKKSIKLQKLGASRSPFQLFRGDTNNGRTATASTKKKTSTES